MTATRQRQQQKRRRPLAALLPLVAAVLVAALLCNAILSVDAAAGGAGSASNYFLPLPPSHVSVASFQRARFHLATATAGASVLLASNATRIEGWPWPAATASNWAQMEPLSIDVSHPTPMMDPANLTPLVDGQGNQIMSPEPPMTTPSLTPAAGQIAVDATSGTLFAISTSARSLLQFKPLSNGVLGFEAGFWVDLVAAELGPAQAVVLQSLPCKEAVIIWALPEPDITNPADHLPSLALVNSTGQIQWKQAHPIVSQSCVDHPDYLRMMIQNDGALTKASATSLMLYAQCGSDIAALNALTGEILWQKPSSADPSTGFFARMHSVSAQTGDLFLASDSTSIERLSHDSGNPVEPWPFSETRKNPPTAPDSELQLLSVEVLEDSRSCATLTVSCTDLQFVNVYEAIAEGDTELRAYMTAFDATAAAGADPTPLWDTTAFFRPGGGSHSQPYPVQMQTGRLVLWLVRSEHSAADGNFDLPVLYVVNATDGSLVRSFDLGLLGLTELPTSSTADPPPSCEVLDVDNYSLGIVVLSCPKVFGRMIVIQDWTAGQPPAPVPVAASSTAEGAGLSSTGVLLSSSGDFSSTGSELSSTGDAGAASSSGAGAAPASLGSDSSSGGSDFSSSTGADTLAAADVAPEDSGFLQGVVLVFVVLFVLLVTCAVMASLAHWVQARRGGGQAQHMRLSQTGGSPLPRGLGRGIHLDGSLDSEWDPESQHEPHWPSEAQGTEMVPRRTLTAAERAALSDHDRAMLELEEAIGAGLAGGYDDHDGADDAHRAGDEDDDEAEFRRAIGQDVPVTSKTEKAKLNSAPSSSSSYAQTPAKNGAHSSHKKKGPSADEDDLLDI